MWTRKQAAERLTVAQENVQTLEGEIDAVKWHMSASDEPTEHDTSSLAELQQAMVETRAELEAATAHARREGSDRMILFQVYRPGNVSSNVHVFVLARGREHAKRVAQRTLLRDPDTYVVEPLTHEGDVIHIDIEVPS